jgi:hypothetical protein
MSPCRKKKTKCDEDGGRMLLGDNKRRADGHAAANQIPVVFSLVLNWNLMFIHDDQKVSVHLMITGQKTRKNILNSFNHLP